MAPRHLVDEREGVEGEEARVAGKAEEVEALVEELEGAAPPGVANGSAIPLVGEEDQDAPRLRTLVVTESAACVGLTLGALNLASMNVEVTAIRPWCASTIQRAMASPSPSPVSGPLAWSTR